MRCLWGVVVSTASVLLLASHAMAERNWEFSVGAFGGKAYHAESTARFNYLTNLGTGLVESVDAKGRGVLFDDSKTFGAKLTAWYLPKKYDWSPQIGLELDWTSFSADLQPQTVTAEGEFKSTGMPVGWITFNRRTDFGISNLGINLLFRYPIWATPEMPHGRWYPYVGIGTGVQRAHMSMTSINYQETSYSPLLQGLVGVKFFLINNVALFAEWKWTQGWHSFNLAGLGAPADYRERYTFATSNMVGGVALHF